MPTVSALFAGISKAQATQGGRFFHAGSFVTLIKGIKLRDTRKSGSALIIENKIIAVRDSGGEPNPLRPNVEVGHVITDGGARKDMFLPNVKQVMTQLAQAMDPGFQPDACTEDAWMQLLDAATSERQLLSGQFVGVNCTQITTKAGKPFTRVNYEGGYSAAGLRQLLAALQQPEEITFPAGELDRLIAEELKATQAA